MTRIAATNLRRNRYSELLGLLVASLAIQSFRTGIGGGDLVFDGIATALGIAIFVAVFDGTRS